MKNGSFKYLLEFWLGWDKVNDFTEMCVVAHMTVIGGCN